MPLLKTHTQSDTLPPLEAPLGLLPEDDRVLDMDQIAELARLERFARGAETDMSIDHKFGSIVMHESFADLNHRLSSGLERK